MSSKAAEPDRAETVSALSATPPLIPDGIPQWSPEVLELHAFLLRIKPENGLPLRRDFEPADVPKLLPHLWLIELGETVQDHFYRLTGSNVAASVGMDYTGKRLVDVHEDLEHNPAAHGFIDEIRESGLPHWYNGKPRAAHTQPVVRVQNLIAPLTDDGVTVDCLIGIAIMELADDRDYDFASPKKRPYLSPRG